MICKNCGTELSDNSKENHPSCPHCEPEKKQEKTESPDILMTIPPDFTAISEKGEEPAPAAVNNSVNHRNHLDETIPPLPDKKRLSPVLIPPFGPPPESFFRKHTKGKKKVPSP